MQIVVLLNLVKQLKKTFFKDDFIKPVQLNEETASNEFIGQLATFTGWTLKSETVSPYVLKKADVMVLKNEGCLVHDGPGQICVEAICGVKKIFTVSYNYTNQNHAPIICLKKTIQNST